DGWASLTMAFLRVSDTGPGFKSEVQDDREVYSVDRITPEVGHGLGLLICREMVERWGGTLEIADVDGAGAAVIVGIPRE
ncbi:MAG: ATP-binding protein, partial [Polyangiales bacterium]